MLIQSRVKRIGNALCVLIPKDDAGKLGLSEGDLVEFEIVRRIMPERMFGSLTFSKSTQQMKDEARSGWTKQ